LEDKKMKNGFFERARKKRAVFLQKKLEAEQRRFGILSKSTSKIQRQRMAIQQRKTAILKVRQQERQLKEARHPYFTRFKKGLASGAGKAASYGYKKARKSIKKNMKRRNSGGITW